MANFIAKFTYSEKDETPDPNVKLAKEREAKEKDFDTIKWKLFVDGSSNYSGCESDLILKLS